MATFSFPHVRRSQSFRSESFLPRSQETLATLKGRRHVGHRYRYSDFRTWVLPHRGQEILGPNVYLRRMVRSFAGDEADLTIDIGTAVSDCQPILEFSAPPLRG